MFQTDDVLNNMQASNQSAPLVHMVTIDPDGRPQISLVWVGLGGDHSGRPSGGTSQSVQPSKR